jgi:hypothetical protein
MEVDEASGSHLEEEEGSSSGGMPSRSHGTITPHDTSAAEDWTVENLINVSPYSYTTYPPSLLRLFSPPFSPIPF